MGNAAYTRDYSGQGMALIAPCGTQRDMAPGSKLHGVSDFNYHQGQWGVVHQHLVDLEASDPVKHISGKEGREAGDGLRERLLQDRGATTVVTALLLTISFAMLCLDPAQIEHAIVFDPADRHGIWFLDFQATVHKNGTISSSSSPNSEGRSIHGIGLVRLMYVLTNIVSTMLSLISIYGGTWEFLLINKCPACQMIYLVEYLHDPKRSWASKALEPYKATVGAAVALLASMVVLIYALYGPWIWGAAVVVILGMSAASWCAFGRYVHAFVQVQEMHEKGLKVVAGAAKTN